MEVGFPVAEEVKNAAEIESDSYFLPSYKALSALYVGRYDDMTEPISP